MAYSLSGGGKAVGKFFVLFCQEVSPAGIKQGKRSFLANIGKLVGSLGKVANLIPCSTRIK